MLASSIIEKKKSGKALSSLEIKEFFMGYLGNKVEDYQMSSLLMAICFVGMNDEETAELTNLIAHSGDFFDWGKNNECYVDKHSTGGVGDKTSLVLLPILTLLGAKVPMISGRGLGHTGGTLDKLQSIPGMQVLFTGEKARRLLSLQGGVFMGQSEDIAPLDRRLYSLRDVTATVGSIPLICSSILGKKISEGISGLVLDVKCGSGAMLPTRLQSENLAKELVKVAKAAGLKVKALLTDMNSPLGLYSGNRLEVLESIELLQGGGPKRTKELCLRLALEMAKLAFPLEEPLQLKTKIEGLLSSGAGFEQFCRIVKAQGGDSSLLADKAFWQQAKIKKQVLADKAGYIRKIDVQKLGLAIIHLGGGRRRVTDQIDFDVGLVHAVHVGDYVDRQNPLFEIHGNDLAKVEEACALLRAAYDISEERCESNALIYEECI